MVCYCPEKKILFIHLPKCAGLTVESILIKKFGFKHFTFGNGKDPYPFLREPRGKIGFYKYILKYSEEAKTIDFSTYRKFAVVRNPYTRAESGIRYLHKCSVRNAAYKDINGKVCIKEGHFPMSIDKFYRTCLLRDYYYVHFCLSQVDSLRDLNNNIDFTIVRFENLMEDLKTLLFDEYEYEYTEIENIHVNKSEVDNLKIKRDNIKNLVRQIHAEDFEILGYDINYEFPNHPSPSPSPFPSSNQKDNKEDKEDSLITDKGEEGEDTLENIERLLEQRGNGEEGGNGGEGGF